MQNKRIKFIFLTVVVILLIPFIIMQFSEDVNWTLHDFIIAGILLLCTGLISDLAIRKIKNTNYKIAITIILLILLLIIWAELAVGIFDIWLSGS